MTLEERKKFIEVAIDEAIEFLESEPATEGEAE